MKQTTKNKLLVALLVPLIAVGVYPLFYAAMFHVLPMRRLDIPFAEAPGAFVFGFILYIVALSALVYALYGALTNWKGMMRK